MELGEKVKQRRIELGMSQEELAKKMGYSSRSSINKIEKGRPITQKIIVRLAKVLNVSVSYLMGWEDEESHANLSISKDTPFVNVIGARISYIRNKRNMTIEELANKVGITSSQLEDMENGINRGFNTELMKKFCNALNVQSSYFISMLEPVESIGLNIKALREINELTENEVANELHISIDKLRNYESGIENIPYDVLDRLANLFNVDVTMLLGMNFKARENEPHFKTTMRILERTRQWNEIVGESNFTDAEMEELMNYAKFILSKRKQ